MFKRCHLTANSFIIPGTYDWQLCEGLSIHIQELQTFAVITSLYVVVLTCNKDCSTCRNLLNPAMCDTIANHKVYQLYH